MNQINQYEANQEFRHNYYQLEDRFIELESFLKHIHDYVRVAQNKIGPGLQLYSSDFFEYYYAGAYGEIFRDSFILIVSSLSEGEIKRYISSWKKLLNLDTSRVDKTTGILDFLKTVNKSYLNVALDFSKKEIVDLRGLLAVRNAIVHSSGTIEYVPQYKPMIEYMTKSYSSIHLTNEGGVWMEEQFCWDSLKISKR